VVKYFGKSGDHNFITEFLGWLTKDLPQLPHLPIMEYLGRPQLSHPEHLGGADDARAKLLEWLLKVLPQLPHGTVSKNRGPKAEDNEAMRELLEWLWMAAVQPVLRELGFHPKPVTPLPRIWWIGVGLMAQAPIHAATRFTKGVVKVNMTTLQYCLPSYTSTIRALQYSRARRQHQCP